MSNPHPLPPPARTPTKLPPNTNFVVLIGGPGIAVSCDHAHDQTWKNYLVPIQIACSKHQIAYAPGEKLNWWVYGPAYSERWNDDVASKQKVQLDAVTSVKNQGAKDYLDRVAQIAASCGASLKVLSSPTQFWSELSLLPDHSVSRLWYIGHASDRGLMLKLIHDNSTGECIPSGSFSDMIQVDDLSKNSSTIIKKLKDKPLPSKFVGCTTDRFAQQWNSLFSAPSEGAVSKIDFSVTDRPSKIESIIPRLQNSQPSTKWRTYGE